MTSDPAKNLPYRLGAGVVLINPEGLIFAGRRRDTDAAAWQMPQGGIDKGEDPAQAAMRELWEETGVTSDLVTLLAEAPDWFAYDLPPELLGNVWKGKYRGQKQRWFLYRFNGRDDQVNIATEHPEFSDWRWIGAEEMLDAIVPFKRPLYAEIIAAFRPWLR